MFLRRGYNPGFMFPFAEEHLDNANASIIILLTAIKRNCRWDLGNGLGLIKCCGSKAPLREEHVDEESGLGNARGVC